jgi:hypothetical protein
MSKYSFITTKVNLYRGDDSPLFGESVTSIELDDDGGGIFFKIVQDPNEFGPGGTLRFDFNEVPKLFEAIKLLEANVKKVKP